MPQPGPATPRGTGRTAAPGVGHRRRGALGTLARYGVDRALAGPALGFPWSTLVVNLAGSFLLGVAVTVMVERWSPTRFARPFVAIGFCGGFTTFSTMVVEAAQRGQHGRVGPGRHLPGGLPGRRAGWPRPAASAVARWPAPPRPAAADPHPTTPTTVGTRAAGRRAPGRGDR